MLQKNRRLLFFLFAAALLFVSMIPAAFAAECQHEWGAWVAAADDPGAHTSTCAICAQTKNESCSYTETVIAATCTTPGYTKHSCKDCGYTYVDTTVELLGHDWKETARKDATCTQDGYVRRVCQRCSLTTSQVLPASHTYTVRTVVPTCTSDGCDRYECINCDYFYTENIIKAPGHKWKPFRPDEDGHHHTRLCETCGASETEECSFSSLVTPPTCTAGGYTDNICTVCEQRILTDYTDPRGHTWDEGVMQTPPTCNRIGTKLCTCVYCTATTVVNLPATGEHSLVTVPEQAATCTQNGKSAWSYCEVCQTVTEEARIIAATGHTFENWKTVKEATCGDGEKEAFCRDCGERTTAVILGSGKHEAQILPAVEATCTTDGKTTGAVCRECGVTMVEQKDIPATGHDWEVEWITEVSCTQDGVCNKSCKNCGEELTALTVKATGHSFAFLPSVAATCTQTGLTAGVYCQLCNTVTKQQQTVPMTPHDMQVIGELAPTCTTDGFRTLQCTVCKKTEQTELAMLGHNIEIISRIEPQCELVGMIVRACTHEGCKFTSNEEIPATGHSYTQIITNATCTQDGYTKHICSVCKHSYTSDTVKATGHSGSLSSTVAPTCTQGGYDLYFCAVCKQSYEKNHTPATGHTWDEGRSFAPTCTESGYLCYTCNSCGMQRTETKEAPTGHSFVSCTSNGDGTHTGICRSCEKNITESCSGGIESCLQKPVCLYCNAEYGDGPGDHSFTDFIKTDDSHTFICSFCGTHGKTQAHSLFRGEYLPQLLACRYQCSVCSYAILARPVGDMDGDGTVAAADARLALRHAVGLNDTLSEISLAAADANGDGEILADDARLLLRKSVGLHTQDLGIVRLDENGALE